MGKCTIAPRGSLLTPVSIRTRSTQCPNSMCSISWPSTLATFRCKIALPEKLIRCTSGDSSSLRQRVLDCSSHDGMSTAAFLGGLRDQPTSHVNEVVGDDPEPHPSLHSIGPVVAATCQPVPPLDHADPAFTSRAPLLASLEPALLLPLAPFWAAGATVRDRNVLHAQSMRA